MIVNRTFLKYHIIRLPDSLFVQATTASASSARAGEPVYSEGTTGYLL